MASLDMPGCTDNNLPNELNCIYNLICQNACEQLRVINNLYSKHNLSHKVQIVQINTHLREET